MAEGRGREGEKERKGWRRITRIPLGRWLLRNPQSLQNGAGPPPSLSPSPRTQLLTGGRAGLLGDPCFGGKWKSVSTAQLLCKENSSQKNHFLAPSRVPSQTERSHMGHHVAGLLL